MAAGIYDESLKFMLPTGYYFLKETDEDGDESCEIASEIYWEEGETKYHFRCGVSEAEININSEDGNLDPSQGELDSGKILQLIRDNLDESSRCKMTKGKNPCLFCTTPHPITFFGHTLNVYNLSLLLVPHTGKLITLQTNNQWDEEDSENNLKIFKHMMTIAESARVNGTKLNLGKLTAESLAKELAPSFDEAESIELEFSTDDDDNDDEPVFTEPEKEPVDEKVYQILSDTISVSRKDATLFLVNNEWLFTLPPGLSYDTDCEYDDGTGGISLSGSKKSMVIQGEDASGFGLNIAVNPHFDFSFNYMTVEECKYDNRFLDDDSSCKREIVSDEPDLYVDAIMIPYWPIGTSLEVRVRGPHISPYDISQMVKIYDDQDSVRNLWNTLLRIARSVKLKTGNTTNASRKGKTTKTAKSGNTKSSAKKTAKIEDPDFIINGTIAERYIGTKRKITIPDGITEIDANMFSGRKITSITVPEGVRSIGGRAFENCFALEEANLPSTLEYLGYYAFVDCHALKRVTLGDRLTCIDNSVFSECYELENVVIPKTVKDISHFAFKNCRKLKQVVIPDGVESIGFLAFAYCTGLEYLYIPASVTTIMDRAANESPFSACPMLTIHGPKGTTAEEYCKTHGIRYEVDYNPIFPTVSVSTEKTSSRSSAGSKQLVTKFTKADPDEALYQYCKGGPYESGSLLDMLLSRPSGGGADYELNRFGATINSYSSDPEFEKRKPLLEKIRGLTSNKYDLHNKAESMMGLFHVNPAVFQEFNDREAELSYNLMKGYYILSALRSFAWTLADYCRKNKKTPDKVDLFVLQDLTAYIEEREWLNYKGDSHCHGLCSGKDQQVYYIPDVVSKADRDALIDSHSDEDFSISSLDKLREDLSYIYPAVKTLHDDLLKKRDRDTQLTGTESDIVYAWVALAIAAQEPFCLDHGPGSYHFGQPETEEEQEVRRQQYEEESRIRREQEEAEHAEKWMNQYGKYVEKNPKIKVRDSVFVFTGLHNLVEKEAEHPVVKKALEEGAQYRSKVSGKTDYLVVDPLAAGESKIKAALEQREKGKAIKIILLEDLKKTLGIKSEKSSEQDVSAIQQAQKLQEAEADLNGLSAEVSKMKEDTDRYAAYLKQKEKRDKAEEEQKKKKKQAASKAEDLETACTMYIILTNEIKSGNEARTLDDFYKEYEEEFPALSKSKLLKLRQKVLDHMDDPEACQKYKDAFHKKTVEERFQIATINLRNVSGMDSVGEAFDWAIEQTKEWFTSEESVKVKELAEQDLKTIRDDIDEQFRTIEEGWMKFRTAKNFLQLVIPDRTADGYEPDPNFVRYERIVDNRIVEVRLATKGAFRMSTKVMTIMSWYWGVTVRDIWEAAAKNDVFDERAQAYDGRQLAKKALEQVRKDFPEGESPSHTGPAKSKLASSDVSSSAEPTKSAPVANEPVTAPSEPVLSQSPQKEGCYIATAVYGSYDAPQVMILRRFRDETLRKSAAGRLFIRTYYRLSPPVAARMKHADRINRFVRSILDKWVEKLEGKKKQ